MPELQGEALRLYRSAHPGRLERFKERGNTCHGGQSPAARGIDEYDIDEGVVPRPPYFHRPEYDVESVYWAMVCVFLQAQPQDAPIEKYACEDVEETWTWLLNHRIPMRPKESDSRTLILMKVRSEWEDLFFEQMHDVAGLLHKISRHIRSEYALFDFAPGSYIEDHLHEAVQRLILDYLVSHRDNPVPLDPDHLRPTNGPSMQRKYALVANARASGTQLVGTGPGMWREGRKTPLDTNDASTTPAAPIRVANMSSAEPIATLNRTAGRAPARTIARRATV